MNEQPVSHAYREYDLATSAAQFAQQVTCTPSARSAWPAAYVVQCQEFASKRWHSCAANGRRQDLYRHALLVRWSIVPRLQSTLACPYASST